MKGQTLARYGCGRTWDCMGVERQNLERYVCGKAEPATATSLLCWSWDWESAEKMHVGSNGSRTVNVGGEEILSRDGV